VAATPQPTIQRRKMNQPYDGENEVSREKYDAHIKPPKTTCASTSGGR